MVIRCLICFIILLSIQACKEAQREAGEIAKIDLDIQVLRFDREFASAGPEDLKDLKSKYPYLFPEQYADSIWVAKMYDPIQKELLTEVDMVFGDFNAEQVDLELLMKHIVYYFPQTSIPKIVTVTSDVDFNNRVILADSLILIGLDNYLGADHHFYEGMSRYIAGDLDKKYIASDVASAFANTKVHSPRARSFLSRMIFHGKILYLKDKWLPQLADTEKIHYSTEQMEWVKANEEQIWRYFIEREYLYSTDQGLGPRFLDPAPFSKFGLELDSESPARVGRYIGWMIVRSFMANNDIELEKMLTLTAEEIFNKSRYKPKN